jgi:ubiquitin carboxyl-terminal hydrolase 47
MANHNSLISLLTDVDYVEKCTKSPSTIYSNDEIFDVDGINVVTNMDIFLEILNDVDKLRVECDNQLSVYVRHWRPSLYQLDSVVELLVLEDSPADLVNKFSAACHIDPENLQIAKMTGTYPCDISVFDIHSKLSWLSPDVTVGCCLRSLAVYTDGAVFCCRDKTESLKHLSDEERKLLEQAENSRFLVSTSNVSLKCRKKEQALKIYTSQHDVCD